jgi:long-chain acyl-CoA synthetase
MTHDHSIGRRIDAVLNIDTAAMALEFEQRWITWGELRDSVAAIDQALTRAGIGRGAPVGVMLRNRPGLIAAVLALLVSQRYIVSLSPFQSSEAIQRDFHRLPMHAVIGDAADWRGDATVQVLRQVGSLGIAIESGQVAPLRVVADFDPTLGRPDAATDTALEILTSGTTGTPKRIRISNRTLNDAIADGARTAGPADPTMPITLKTTPTIIACSARCCRFARRVHWCCWRNSRWIRGLTPSRATR